ncbi:MAG: hypothetical protein SGCHY_004036 [Lobulomycetales sp.]
MMIRNFATKAGRVHLPRATRTFQVDKESGLKVPRQEFTGVVIGTKAQRTVKVRVERNNIHPVVLKNVVSHKNFLVHDPEEACVVGDLVKCVSCLKVSKRKNFVVGEIVKPAERYADSTGKLHTQAAERKRDDSIETQMKLYGKTAVEDLKELENAK